MKPVYLDYNATTPLDPEVTEALRPFLDNVFGNPSSSHEYGIIARQYVESARTELAKMIVAGQDEILFTSGGSESNNMAIKGYAFANASKGRHLITSAIEHPAVTEVFKYLKVQGFEVTFIPVDGQGLIDPGEFKKAIRPGTILASIMHANNEVGTIQPIEELSRIAREHCVILHCDAAQSAGKIPVDINKMGVDMLSLAGHKFYAPKGIGVLYCRRGIKLSRMLHGAEHEQGMRAGTENIMGIAGIGKAAELVSREFGGANAALTATSHEPQAISHEFFQAAPNRSAVTVKDLRDRLHHSISEVFPLSRLNGHPVKRLPNTLSLGFRGQDASVLLNEWKGLAASAGAACHAGLETISAVLLAMNVPREYALGTIRFSLGRMTTAKDIETATGIITEWAGRKQGSVIFHAMPFAARDSKEDGPEIKRTEAQDDPGHGEFRHMDSPVNPLSTDDLAAAERPLPPEAGPPGGIRLTAFTHSLGCACKIKPQSLEKILKAIPVPDDKSVLVGTETSDDAAVYLFSRNKAIVQTVDFIPPVVDDPYHYGAIASANALSDVYAMGGKPLFALSIVAFPEKLIPYEVLGEIIRGATDKVREAGISIIGGHSIEDEEPKFGLVVCGEVNPGKIWKNSTPRSGDVLVLTKPLGTGIITTAIKRKYAGEAAAAEAVAVMSTLNKYAAEILMKYDVHACTDITGFGLLGHLKEMLSAGNLDAEISWQTVPLLTEAMNYAVAGMIPGGTRNNLEFVKKHLRIRDDVPALVKILFSDAQTSGGLLVSLPEEDAMKALPELARRGIVQAGMIGRVVPGDSSIVIR